MRELSGVTIGLNPFSPLSLKQQLLVFDKLRLFKPPEGTVPDLDFLAEQGAIEYIPRQEFDDIFSSPIAEEVYASRVRRLSGLSRRSLGEAQALFNAFVRKYSDYVRRYEEEMSIRSSLLQSVDRFYPALCHGRPTVKELVNAHFDFLTAIQIEERSSSFASFGIERDLDNFTRLVASYLSAPSGGQSVPICSSRAFDTNRTGDLTTVLHVTLEHLPLPDDSSSLQDILEFKSARHDELWCLRRFLNSLATKKQTEAEIRDDIEWSLNEYTTAMKLHNLKAGNSFIEVYLIPVLDVLEDMVKFNWSNLARGAISVKKRQIELMEVEMKAPGRECAYLFHANRSFPTTS